MAIHHHIYPLDFVIKYMLGLLFFYFPIHVDLDPSCNVNPIESTPA